MTFTPTKYTTVRTDTDKGTIGEHQVPNPPFREETLLWEGRQGFNSYQREQYGSAHLSQFNDAQEVELMFESFDQNNLNITILTSHRVSVSVLKASTAKTPYRVDLGTRGNKAYDFDVYHPTVVDFYMDADRLVPVGCSLAQDNSGGEKGGEPQHIPVLIRVIGIKSL